MHCFECSQAGIAKDAIGTCHHSSAGLCADHVCVEADPLTTLYALSQATVLPKKARLLFCKTCQEALEEPHLRKTA